MFRSRPFSRRYPALLLLAVALSAILSSCQSMPEGLSVTGPVRSAERLEILRDQTYQNAQGTDLVDQEIFDEAFRLIAQARRLVVVDMFLFNAFAGEDSYRPLSEQLTKALISAKQRHPDMPVVMITDPFNTLYGGLRAPELEQLRAAGVDVVLTDIDRLPASNPAWTGIWQLCCSYLGNNTEGGWLPNPVGPGKITLRSYLHLANFRANHRKTLIVDNGEDWRALVTSANPHDASSRHHNSAIVFSGAAALDLLQTERAAALVSGYTAAQDWPTAPDASGNPDLPHIQILTEGAIERSLLELVASAQSGDQLDMEMFYLSSRPVIEALIDAQARGVQVRAILDANRDAFGREKNGIPNRQAAWDLHEQGVAVRWCATTGEQCHRKWIRLERSQGITEVISGSANFTRRNLHDLNLETSVRLTTQADNPEIVAMRAGFEKAWSNSDGGIHSLPYSAFADNSYWRYGLYRFMEASGLSTF
ncbi:phospholipase [Pseudomonas neustonica]|uniref:phospholipase D n=1 Tax=Pseudomonas neustonica TaxID=2487346 RepID=A0ABX9XI99_9PSED|nr:MULTISPECIES: phospholipase D-like domain-containing protein [Pseudomonas]ROZ83006.1 phospholipase [Pseudomonas sp. SSM44]ROZ84896.1 phospholipase [Pseudomonas neustonica]